MNLMSATVLKFYKYAISLDVEMQSEKLSLEIFIESFWSALQF